MQNFVQVQCSHSLFVLHGYGLHYNTGSKRVNREIIVFRRKSSFYAESGSLFTPYACFYMHYNIACKPVDCCEEI